MFRASVSLGNEDRLKQSGCSFVVGVQGVSMQTLLFSLLIHAFAQKNLGLKKEP
jgi:hypothetical protein